MLRHQTARPAVKPSRRSSLQLPRARLLDLLPATRNHDERKATMLSASWVDRRACEGSGHGYVRSFTDRSITVSAGYLVIICLPHWECCFGIENSPMPSSQHAACASWQNEPHESPPPSFCLLQGLQCLLQQCLPHKFGRARKSQMQPGDQRVPIQKTLEGLGHCCGE